MLKLSPPRSPASCVESDILRYGKPKCVDSIALTRWTRLHRLTVAVRIGAIFFASDRAGAFLVSKVVHDRQPRSSRSSWTVCASLALLPVEPDCCRACHRDFAPRWPIPSMSARCRAFNGGPALRLRNWDKILTVVEPLAMAVPSDLSLTCRGTATTRSWAIRSCPMATVFVPCCRQASSAASPVFCSTDKTTSPVFKARSRIMLRRHNRVCN